MWSLLGSRTREVLAELGPPTPLTVSDTTLSREFARWVIRHEWVARLGDLIERRLMLVHERRLTNACLRDLADLLVEHGLLAEQDRDAEIADETERLKTHFGRDLAAESKPSHP